MKKLMFAVGLGLISGSLYAACMGPFCWDDQGAYIGGVIQDGNGQGVPTHTGLYIDTTVPRATAQEVVCSSCASNGTNSLCISTATTIHGYVFVASTGTVCR